MKILIIDDDMDELTIAKSRLAKECDEIICADGGKTGIEAANRERPDIILLDVDMPDMSGYDVCRALKSNPELCMIPILFLSGMVNPEDKIKGLDMGAVDYISKPFDVFELQARVRAALRTKNLQDLLIEYANIDPLTGLPNRRALMGRIKQEWNLMQRNGRPFSLVMADIDHFKKINDTFGHIVGDQLLREVGKVFAKECRKIDMPARFGGEEFAILVPQESADNALCVAERCRKAVENINLDINGGLVNATASFGIAEADLMSTPEVLIKHADEAMYDAKVTGRNRIVTYDDIHQEINS